MHMAAMRDDRKAIQTLLDAGANRTVRIGCDDDATAPQEARILGHHACADFTDMYEAPKR